MNTVGNKKRKLNLPAQGTSRLNQLDADLNPEGAEDEGFFNQILISDDEGDQLLLFCLLPLFSFFPKNDPCAFVVS
jgi:hypothetical protein